MVHESSLIRMEGRILLNLGAMFSGAICLKARQLVKGQTNNTLKDNNYRSVYSAHRVTEGKGPLAGPHAQSRGVGPSSSGLTTCRGNHRGPIHTETGQETRMGSWHSNSCLALGHVMSHL